MFHQQQPIPLSTIDASRVLGSSASGPVSVWDASALRRYRNNPAAQQLYQAIDELGRGSRVAQGLKSVLTSVERLLDNPAHRLYLLQKDRQFIGIIKIGVKKLFIRTKTGDLKEIDPLCVLDFYVVESEQRSGQGRVLYDAMIHREQIAPHHLGYDKPSPKFLGFLRKHFGLSDYIPQTNNFVVFEQYFSARGAVSGPQPAAQAPMPLAAPQRCEGGALPRPQGSAPAPIPLQPSVAAAAAPTQAIISGQAHQRGAPPVASSAMPGSQRTVNSLLPASHSAHAASRNISAALAATLPKQREQSAPLGGSPAAPLGGSVRVGRNMSPTRSSAGYNIITCADEVGSPGPLSRTYYGR
jgi:alpha-tubulin N-acetyltransferase 1